MRTRSHLARRFQILLPSRFIAVCIINSSFNVINTYFSCFSASEHRDSDGRLIMAEMEQLPCRSIIRVYEPLEEYRSACPRVLVVCCGAHTHPIPQPLKTPPLIWLQIFKLLQLLSQDLSDLTPCQFLRHPTVCSYLHNKLPYISHPSLSDWHVSLANREHL
jgi:hypothetical protein